MGLAMGALAAEKNMGRLRKLLEKLVPGQEAGVASETTDKGRPQKKTQQNCNALKSTKQFYAKYSWGLCEGLPNTPDQRVVMLSQKKKLLHAVKALKRRPGNMEKIQEGERLLAVYREKAASVVQTMGRYAQYVERIERNGSKWKRIGRSCSAASLSCSAWLWIWLHRIGGQCLELMGQQRWRPNCWRQRWQRSRERARRWRLKVR